MIDDVIAWHMTSFVQKKHEKDVVEIITFDLIGLLPTNHIIAYITMAYRSFLRKLSFNINSKTAQTTQNIWNFIVRKSNLEEMKNFGD